MLEKTGTWSRCEIGLLTSIIRSSSINLSPSTPNPTNSYMPVSIIEDLLRGWIKRQTEHGDHGAQ